MGHSQCGKNVDFVAFQPNLATGWTFTVPVSATTPEDLEDELLSLMHTVIDAASQLLTPTGLEYAIHWGKEFEDINEFEEFPQGDRRRMAVSESSSFEDALSSLRKDLPGTPSTRHLAHLVVDESLVNVCLEEGDFKVDRTSSRYKYWHDGEVRNKECTDPPLTFEITCLSHREPPRFDIVLWTHTDIWFEETELGAANRRRLGAALSKLATDLDILEADVYEGSYFAETLRKKGFHELLPENYAEL